MTLDWIAAAVTMLGTVIIISQNPLSRSLGFTVHAVGNFLWLLFGVQIGYNSIVFLSVVFFLVNIGGSVTNLIYHFRGK